MPSGQEKPRSLARRAKPLAAYLEHKPRNKICRLGGDSKPHTTPCHLLPHGTHASYYENETHGEGILDARNEWPHRQRKTHHTVEAPIERQELRISLLDTCCRIVWLVELQTQFGRAKRTRNTTRIADLIENPKYRVLILTFMI